jgi:hypothetical protein
MAELERVKADQKMVKAFTNLQDSTVKTLQKANKLIREIETSGNENV